MATQLQDILVFVKGKLDTYLQANFTQRLTDAGLSDITLSSSAVRIRTDGSESPVLSWPEVRVSLGRITTPNSLMSNKGNTLSPFSQYRVPIRVRLLVRAPKGKPDLLERVGLCLADATIDVLEKHLLGDNLQGAPFVELNPSDPREQPDGPGIIRELLLIHDLRFRRQRQTL